MSSKITIAICFATSVLIHAQVVAAPVVTVDLTNNTSLGVSLDDIDASEVGTATAGPFNVPGIAGLTITVTGVSSTDTGAETNVTSASLGMNSDNDADTDAFEAAFEQTVTLQFNQAVLVHELDFTTFTSGEAFSFAGVAISSAEISSSDYTFATPLAIGANTDFSLFATSGTIGIKGFDIEVVPEPSSFALFGGLSLLAFARRRRSI